MAQFTAEVYQNEFLPPGGTDVHAIVTVTCTGAGEAGRGEGGDDSGDTRHPAVLPVGREC